MKTGLVEGLKQCGQDHVLKSLDELPVLMRPKLVQSLENLSLDQIPNLVSKFVVSGPNARAPRAEDISPPPVVSFACLSEEDRRTAFFRGCKSIAEGKVACVLLAGGQASRLGISGPKGCVRVTCVKEKSLFQVLCERIRANAELAARTIGSCDRDVKVPLYIMTSPLNDAATREFFEQNDFFGLRSEDVRFFQQGTLPVFSLDGKILLEPSGVDVFRAPDGHGGVFEALRESGTLDAMDSRGVETISLFQVDNPLMEILDPIFIGLHTRNSAEMSFKAIVKKDPQESLGNPGIIGGSFRVIEYCDFPIELGRQKMASGRPLFAVGTCGTYLIALRLIRRSLEREFPYHRAIKRCSTSMGVIQAVKLERFLFDIVEFASSERVLVFEVDRVGEYAPVKNAVGENSLTLSQSRQLSAALLDIERFLGHGISVSPDGSDSPSWQVNETQLTCNGASLKVEVSPLSWVHVQKYAEIAPANRKELLRMLRSFFLSIRDLLEVFGSLDAFLYCGPGDELTAGITVVHAGADRKLPCGVIL